MELGLEFTERATRHVTPHVWSYSSFKGKIWKRQQGAQMTNVCADKLAKVRRMRPASFTTAWFWRAGDSVVCAQFHIPSVFLSNEATPHSQIWPSVNANHHKRDVFESAWEDLLQESVNENINDPISEIRSEPDFKSASLSFSTTVIILPFETFYINYWGKWKYYVLYRYLWHISLVK